MCPAATTLIARIKDQFKTVEDMETIFKQMDLNCNGKMTKEEMIKAGNFNEQEVDAVFDLGDVDRDGEIDLNEFIGVMQTAAPQAYSQAGEDIEIGNVGVLVLCFFLQLYTLSLGIKFFFCITSFFNASFIIFSA